VYDQVCDRLPFGFDDLGEQQVKNIARPVRVYRVTDQDRAKPETALPLTDRPSIAVLPFQNMSADPEHLLHDRCFFGDFGADFGWAWRRRNSSLYSKWRRGADPGVKRRASTRIAFPSNFSRL
jgi:hypothetical protein